MASTMTVVLILNREVFLGHVGDSRLYLLRNNYAHLVTDDHTLGQEMLNHKKISKSSAELNKLNSVLSRSIGTNHHVKVDTFSFDIIPGDNLLLCSDGLSNYIKTPLELLPMVDSNIDTSLQNLIDYGISRGGSDNITTVMISAILEEKQYHDFDHDKIEILDNFSLVERCPFFRKLSFKSINTILPECELKDFSDGETICKSGKSTNGIYIVIEGKVIARDADINKQQYRKGQHFGEYSLMRKYREKSSYTAKGNCTLLFLSHKKYQQLCHSHPKTGVRLLRNYIRLSLPDC